MGARNMIRVLTEALLAADNFDLKSGDVMKVIPVIANTGSIEVGTGVKNIPLKAYADGNTYVELNTVSKAITFSGVSLAGTVKLSDNVPLNFGDDNDVSLTWDTSNLTMVPLTDNVGSFTIGQVGKTMDFVVVSDSGKTLRLDVSDNQFELVGIPMTTDEKITLSGNGYIPKKVVTLSANTTLTAAHFSALIIQNNNGPTVFTLPAPSAGNAGAYIDFASVLNQPLTITSTGKIIYLNDTTSDSVRANTAGEQIGATCRIVSASSKWVFFPGLGTWTSLT